MKVIWPRALTKRQHSFSQHWQWSIFLDWPGHEALAQITSVKRAKFGMPSACPQLKTKHIWNTKYAAAISQNKAKRLLSLWYSRLDVSVVGGWNRVRHNWKLVQRNEQHKGRWKKSNYCESVFVVGKLYNSVGIVARRDFQNAVDFEVCGKFVDSMKERNMSKLTPMAFWMGDASFECSSKRLHHRSTPPPSPPPPFLLPLYASSRQSSPLFNLPGNDAIIWAA